MEAALHCNPSYPEGLRQLLESLNDFQLAAVNIGPGLSSLIGVPGSGKTRTIVARIARLAADGLDPNYILAMTFTRNAAFEMNERLKALGIDTARVGTIHSVCRQIVAGETKLFDSYQLDDRGRLKLELKKLLSDLRRNDKIPRTGVDREGVGRFIEACKAHGLCYVYGDPFGMNIRAEGIISTEARKWRAQTGLSPRELSLVYTELEKRRASRGLHDFDDMLLWCWMQLVASEEPRRRWRQRWSVVIVDEVQDSNPVQWDISRLLVGLDSCVPHVRELAEPPGKDEGLHNLMVGGDPSQCHPADTMIDLDSRGKDANRSPIQNLKTGDKIGGWNRHGQKMIGGRRIKVARRQYKGPMLRVSTATRTTRVTPNHRFICRWTERGSKVCVTYLMYRRGFGYRVGWCQLFSGKYGFHLSQRARLEKADALWILEVHKTRAEASLAESVVAAKYGLPTITFEPPNGAVLYGRAGIKSLFSVLADVNGERGERCLHDYGRDPALPLWPWPNQPKGAYLRATYFEVFAANLLPGAMSVPLPDERNKWSVINRVESGPYDGWIYSLDVEKDHSYAADGIVVLNSIYGWRSAEPNLFVQFSTDAEVTQLVLPINYRSNTSICAVGTGLVRGKAWHLAGEIKAHRLEPAPGAVSVMHYQTPEEEASATIRRCMEIAQSEGFRSCVVLSRLSVGLNIAEIECIRNRVPYVKRASGSFFESSEIKDILAYLRVSSGFDPDGRWLRHVINHPFRYIGSAFIAESEMHSQQHGCSLIDAMMTLGDRLTYRQLKSIQELYLLLQKLNGVACKSEEMVEELASEDEPSLTAGPAKMIAMVLDTTDYIEEIRREEGLLSMDESKIVALSELQRIASLFKKVSEFLAYIDALIVAVRKAQRSGLRVKDEENKDALVLSTIHRAKGLEWSHVFLVDVSAGRFPHSKAQNPDEELRLLYVAETRAKETCAVSYSGADSCGSGHDSEDEDEPFSSHSWSRRRLKAKSPFIELIRQQIALLEK